jgi:quercetin dioxygenase-like cupin family protein
MASHAKGFVGQRVFAIVALVLAVSIFQTAPAPAEGKLDRTELSRADLSGSATMEVIVARLEMFPGASIPQHFHFGDEHLIVVQGGPATLASGKVIEFTTGAALHFPAGKVHGGFTASGEAPLIVYTMHIVEKGKPMMNLVE